MSGLRGVMAAVVAGAAVALCAGSADAAFLIDNFDLPAGDSEGIFIINPAPGTTIVPDNPEFGLDGTQTIGGSRELALTLDSGSIATLARTNPDLAFGGGTLAWTNGSGSSSTASVVWEGWDGDSAEGLGNVDLTDGGVLNAFLLSVLSSDLGFTATFDIYDSVTDAAPSSTLSQDFGPVPFGSGPVAYTMLFSSFTDPAILTSADKIVLTLTGPAETDVTLDFIQAVPEPASVGLMLASLPGVVVFARRRRRLLSPR